MSAADRLGHGRTSLVRSVVSAASGLGLGQRALVIGLVVIVAAGLGVLSVVSAEFAVIGAVAVLALGVLAIDPLLVVILAVPGSLLMMRVGGALSVADVVLAAGMLVALLLLRGKDVRDLQPLIWAGVAYLAAALPTLVLNPYTENLVEWLHEFVLVIGSMLVGYTVGRFGRAQTAVSLYVVVCLGIAVVASVVGAGMFASGQGFGPVYLPDLHKNAIGGSLAAAIVLLYARSAWFSWRPGWSGAAILVLGVGLLASQSRQAMLGAVAGLLIVSLRRRPDTGRFPRLVWFAAVPVVVLVLTMVNDQLTEDNRFNSANQRLDWYAQTIEIWETSPVFGVGLRWWYTDRFPGAGFQPPNAELEVISSVGVVGLLGFLVMFAVGFWALWRIDPAYGTVGAAIVVTRFVQAQFDLYWVAGQASFLWIVGGICIGALAYKRDADERAGRVMSPGFAPALTPRRR